MAGSAPQARSHPAWIRRLGAFLAFFAPGAAHAGAWVTAGEDRSISTVGFSQNDGAVASESDLYIEKALNDRFALVGHTFNALDGFGEEQNEADVGVKVLGFRTERIALAVQGAGTWRSEVEPGCPEAGAEVRALAGRAFEGGHTFLNGEVAYRYGGACSHVRYEATAGWRPNAAWLGLAQIFVDDDLRFGETLKAQASLVRFSRKGRGLQLSARVRIQDGDVIEPTLILGYWSAHRR